MLDALVQDVRFALRMLTKTPVFTGAVIATIALGVGATTAIFTVVNAVLLRPLPFQDSDRTVMLCETNPSIGNWCGASPMNVADWARDSHALESAGVARGEPFIATSGGEHYGVAGGIASPGFFQVLRLKPPFGRLFEQRDMARGANHVVLVSHAYWISRLGSDPAIVGSQIVLDGTPFTVIGVLPSDAYVPRSDLADAQVWKPLTASMDNVEDRTWRGFTAIGRMAPGVSQDALYASLAVVRSHLEQAYPEANRNWGLRIADLRSEVVGDVRPTLWIFLGAVGFVLLIVCANVASLLMVRATGRTSEFAVRVSLGAPRRRLVQQLVTESLLVSLAGGALGLLVAAWATTAFVALAPSSIPRLNEVSIDWRVVVFAFVLSAATALVFGVAPARQALRSTVHDSLKALRVTGGAQARVRSALVVAELALALMLLVGAGLLARSFARLLDWDPGFAREGLATAWMLPPQSVEDSVGVMERVRDDVASIPGVASAALASGGPLFGGTETGGLQVEGMVPFAPAEMPTIQWFDISPHYFDTLGVRLVRGRWFTADDGRGATQVGIVNETFAHRFFGSENPIGRRVSVDSYASEIVGVVADVRPFRPDRETPPQIYWPIEQYRRGAAYLVLRATGAAAGLDRAIQARAQAAAPGAQVSPLVTLDERLGRNLVSPRFNMILVAAFALAAMLLAAVGVYGVLAYTVASRTREIGVRIALGARPRTLLAGVIRSGMKLAAMGIALGCVGALALGRVLTSLLYGLPPNDPAALSGAVVLFALVALAACWWPARRASRMNPVTALRVE